jgi:two-component system chemotaxis response regulator CheB
MTLLWRRRKRAGRAAASAARPETPYDLVAIVASTGGVKALEEILAWLPADFPVPIAVVQHRSTQHPNLLARVLGRHTELTVKLAEEGEVLQPGKVYLAQPDLHLVVNDNRTLGLRNGHRIRHVLSSGNPLFESAAQALGERVIAIVLTGYDSDGTDGVQAVKNAGGTVIAQDEASSQAFNMPRSAIETGCVDRVLALGEIGPALVQLAS